MFQKISSKRKTVIVLVRTPEDLERCDALVIPGGGERSSVPTLGSPSHVLTTRIGLVSCDM